MDDFIEYFADKLKKLIPHYFISSEQSKFVRNVKSELKLGEFLGCCDFAENYSFVIKNEAQGYHWNNKQATIHLFVTYYKDLDKDTNNIL